MAYNDIDKLQYTLLSELISTNYIEIIYLKQNKNKCNLKR